jgi:hypothetical protein
MNQPQTIPHHLSERGDELDLMQLWKVLVKYKLLIIVVTILTTIGAIYYTLSLPNIYRSEVLMTHVNSNSNYVNRGDGGGLFSMFEGGGGGVGVEAEQELARLKTRSFLIEYIKEKNLKPVLFANQWNKAEEKWNDVEPLDIVAADFLNGMLTADSHRKSKANLASVIIKWKNPTDLNRVPVLANGLADALNINAKKRAISEAEKSIFFLEKELKKTDVIKSQAILYGIIEKQFQVIMAANIKDSFVFDIIDPAIVPSRSESKSILIFILTGVILGIFLGSFLAININYFKSESH